jgi:hypothetical protein
MSASVQTQAHLSPSQLPARCWGFALRIAFRFCFLYFGLYCLLTQILTSLLPLPNVEVPDFSTLPPFRQIV